MRTFNLTVIATVCLLFTILTTRAQTPHVNPLTGAIGLEIPIYALQQGDLAFPIILSYSGKGVRTTDVPSWVGQNWNLSVDGGVYRTVRGLPDDYQGAGADLRRGWLNGDMGTRIYNFTSSIDTDPGSCVDEVADWSFLNTFDYNQDTEPDVFTVNALGLSFDFYFDENKQWRVANYSDVSIEFTKDPVTTQFLSFTITDERGIKYQFETLEKITEDVTSAPVENYFLKRLTQAYKDPISYTTCWKLTRITGALYGTIDLSYKNVTIINPIKIPDPPFRGKANQSSYISGLTCRDRDYFGDVMTKDITITRQILQTISTIDTRIVFQTSLRQDNTGDERLDRIQVFEKRVSPEKLIKETLFGYQEFYTTAPADVEFWDEIIADVRSYLISVTDKSGTQQMPPYQFQYYGIEGNDIALSQASGDEWGFDFVMPEAGSLKKITAPLGGYSYFFYEPHEFINAENTPEKGGGIRVRKIITHNAVSSASDLTKEYSYTTSTGTTSGRALWRKQDKLTTVRLIEFLAQTNQRYRDLELYLAQNPSQGPITKYFDYKLSQDYGLGETLQGSNIAYTRVTVKHPGEGMKVYEYDLPAMYGSSGVASNDWNASEVNLARPAVAGAQCYERGHIPVGINVFPFPPNPRYNHARGLPKKVSDFNEAGHLVKETRYEYQRIYKGTATRMVYGLALEELPTSYHNGTSYVDNKLFLFSKYAIHTGIGTNLKKEIITIYKAPSLTDKTETTTTYFYESNFHRNVSRVETTESDQSLNTVTYKYARDYTIATPQDIPANGLSALQNTNRNELIETILSNTRNGVQKFLSGEVRLFQKINNKAFPYSTSIFENANGLTSFSPASIVTTGGNSTFNYDEVKFSLVRKFISFDNQGNLTESHGLDGVVSSTAIGYGGTLAVASFDNASLSETAFSDFETANPVDFTLHTTPSYSTGRTGKQSLVLAGGSSAKLSRTITTSTKTEYTFRCWVKSSQAGDLTLSFKNISNGSIINPVALPYDSQGQWKLYSIDVKFPVLHTTFTVEMYPQNNISVDDIAFYPSSGDILTQTYDLPYGKSSQTDTRGLSSFYSYDDWSRLTIIKDHNKNIIKKIDYHTRPQ